MASERFIFAGDFAPCRNYRTLVESEKTNIFGDLVAELEKSDFAFLNLETPLTNYNKSIFKDGPALNSSPTVAKVIKDAGFTCVGLANNHILDYGEVGLLDTVDALKEQSLDYCGAGGTLEDAQAVKTVKVGDKTVSILAICETEFNIASNTSPGAAPIDLKSITLSILQAKMASELIFVTIHGGNEYFSLPRPGLIELCRYLVDLGVSGVFCHHPHVPGPYEIYKGKPIVYSLGNFIFDHSNPPDNWDLGYAFVISFDDDDNMGFDVLPYSQSVKNGGVELMRGDKKLEFLNYIKDLNEIVADAQQLNFHWNKFCLSSIDSVYIRLFFPFKFRGARKLYSLFKFLFDSKFYKNKKLEVLNGLRCESHYELTKTVLELDLKDRSRGK